MRHFSGDLRAAVACAAVLGAAACSLDSSAPTGGGDCTRVGTVALGDTLRDSLVASSCRQANGTYAAFYAIQVDSPQSQVRLALASGAPAFMVLGDARNAIIVNSLYTDTLGTTAAIRIIAKGGRYVIGVNSGGQAPSGAFSLTFARDSSPVRGCTPIWVTTGITTAQTLTASDCTFGPQGTKYYTHLYLAVILGNEELRLTEHTTAFPPQAQLVGQNGQTAGLSSLDSTGANAVVDFVPSTDNLLLMWLGSSDSLQTGAYTLTIK